MIILRLLYIAANITVTMIVGCLPLALTWRAVVHVRAQVLKPTLINALQSAVMNSMGITLIQWLAFLALYLIFLPDAGANLIVRTWFLRPHLMAICRMLFSLYQP